MNQRLFVLYGRQDSGKTCTIKKACEMFATRKGAAVSVRDSGGGEDDIVCAVKINGTNIGFSSSGDSREEVENGLEELKDCEIVVCATREKRTRDESMQAIYDHAERGGHIVYWIHQPALDVVYENGNKGVASIVNVDSYRNKINQVVADLIINVLKAEVVL